MGNINTPASPRIFYQEDVDTSTWPITISGGTNSDPSGIVLGEDIVLTLANQYFIFGSEYVSFDGSGHTVTIQDVANYPGLVQNGLIDFIAETSTDGQGNVSVQNVGITTSGNSTLAPGAGWVGQAGFGIRSQTVSIYNCYSTGPISATKSGGILGTGAGAFNGQITVWACYSTGDITGNYSGGLVGSHAGFLGYGGSGEGSGVVTIVCYSTGAIGTNSSQTGIGGIFGSRAGYQSSILTIACYTTGNIVASNSGGIFGDYAGSNNGYVVAFDSYTLGTISGSVSGGIYGSNTGDASGNIHIGFLYVVGRIENGTEGIYGSLSTDASYAIDNPYYIENSGIWNDANAVLIGVNTPQTDPGPFPIYNGIFWIDVDENAPNVPYKLAAFNSTFIGDSIYYPNIDTALTNDTYVSDIGNPIYLSFSIVTINNSPILSNFPDVSIDISNGVITITNPLTLVPLVIRVYATNDENGTYSTDTFTLNGQPITPPTPLVLNTGFLDYPILNDINNGILSGQKPMPAKDSTSDGASSFAMGRRGYLNMYGQNIAPSPAQNVQKKWIGGNRDASQIVANRHIASLGSGSLNASGGPLTFMSSTNKNVVADALIRTRSGGSNVPKKVSHKYLL